MSFAHARSDPARLAPEDRCFRHHRVNGRYGDRTGAKPVARARASGVLEGTIDAMRAPSALHAWMGPAIGPRVYEVGDEVRAAFPGHEAAFKPNRPGHWLMDLYAIARKKLEAKGAQVHGGGF